jgi:capsular polysaccharide biosynthesis protein
LGEVIRESLINTHGLLEFGPFKRERVGTELLVNDGDLTGKRQDIKNAVLLKQLWDTNYGHWLIETLPRLELVDECFDIAKCKFIIGGDRGAIGQVYLDTLALFGVPNENIVRLDEASSFENLIYPAPLTIQPWIKAPRVIKFLERLGQKALSDYVSPSRLYVSRDSNAKRVLLNEEAVLEIVLKYGFFPIDPGRVDFQSQVRMFRNATHVIGNLGAAMTNVVFAPRGVKVLALATQCMQDDFFWDLVCQKEGEYVSLHGNAITPASGMYSDFRIDIEQLSGVMAEFV